MGEMDKYKKIALALVLVGVIAIAGCAGNEVQENRSSEEIPTQNNTPYSSEPMDSIQQNNSEENVSEDTAPECIDDNDCNDTDPCTKDACVNGVCSNVELPSCNVEVQEEQIGTVGGGVAILSHRNYETEFLEDDVIVGEVENKDTRNFKWVEIIAKIYSSDVPAKNTQIGEESTYSFKDILKPGEISPFKIYLGDYGSSFQSYDLQVDYSTTNEEPLDLEVIRDEYDDLNKEIYVKIKNNGPTTSKYTEAAVTYYTNSGKVSTVESSYFSEEFVPVGTERTIIFEKAPTSYHSITLNGMK